MHLYMQLHIHVRIHMNTCMFTYAGRMFLTRNAYRYKGFKLSIWGRGMDFGIFTWALLAKWVNCNHRILGIFFFNFFRCGTCYFKLYSLWPNIFDIFFPMYKSTKSPAAAARVKKRCLISRIIISRIRILPSCNPHPSYLQRPSPGQLLLCPGLQAAVSSRLPPLHHHRKRWEELQGAGKLLGPLRSLSIFPDPSPAHKWHFLPASLGACKANSHLVLLARLPKPEHQLFPARSQYPAKKLFSLNASWGVSHRAPSVRNYILCFQNRRTPSHTY